MPGRGAARPSRRLEALKAQGTLHPRPQDVTDPLFRESPFFDAHDIVQVKYQMLRRVRLEARRVSEAAADFGFSRPSFYTARAAFERGGVPGLLPQKRGPRQPHKLTDEVLATLATVRTEEGTVPRTTALAALVNDRFGITVHPRSIERSLLRYIQRQEKNAASRILGLERFARLRNALRNAPVADDRIARGGDRSSWHRPGRPVANRPRRMAARPQDQCGRLTARAPQRRRRPARSSPRAVGPGRAWTVDGRDATGAVRRGGSTDRQSGPVGAHPAGASSRVTPGDSDDAE